MKRMLCFISDMILPNFIPLNEAATKPDVIHAIFTPSEKRMQKRLEDLKMVVEVKFPDIEIKEVPIFDAYDSAEIYRKCKEIVQANPNDAWSLNATGGTKLMSSPADEYFRDKNLAVYYVDTRKNCILEIAKDWSSAEIPFQNSIDVETYFALHGHKIKVETPRTNQEQKVFDQLKQLDWDVWASVNWLRPDDERLQIAEYDIIGIKNYKMSVFECKRLNINRYLVASGHATQEELDKVENDILSDLYKLSQAQKSFGGFFSKIYWIFNGQAKINRTNYERMKEFNITLIKGDEVSKLVEKADEFGFPPKR
ncbi:hypothetical protein BH20ACI4_BH20ACI4_15490 [soil metagenome]